jgi:peptidoglycan L-alanyl-D-glutamate endopeptidase CwlK
MTLDPRSEKNLATLDPKVQEQFRAFLVYAKDIADDFMDCDVKLISGHRTWKEQDALYAQGRTKPGKKVTNAKGGQSNHNFGIAGDIGIFRRGDYLDDNDAREDAIFCERIYKHLAKKAEAFGMEAGYNWKTKDPPHFEIATGLTLAQKRARYAKYGTLFP